MSDEIETPETERSFEEHFNDFADGVEPEVTAEEDQEVAQEVDDVAVTEAVTEEFETESEVDEDTPLEIVDPVADIWANASEEQRAELEAVRRDRAEIEHRYKSDEGRVSALQRKINDLEAMQHQAPVVIPQATPMSEEGIDSFRQDYPDIADAVDKMVQSKMTTEREGFSQAMSQMQQQMNQAIQPFQESEQQRYVDTQLQALESTHPDWREVAQSSGFMEWMNVQPETIRSMFNSDSAQDAAYLVGSFKQTLPRSPINEQTTSQQASNKQALNEAVTPRSRRTASTTTSAPDDYEAAFDYWVDKGK